MALTLASRQPSPDRFLNVRTQTDSSSKARDQPNATDHEQAVEHAKWRGGVLFETDPTHLIENYTHDDRGSETQTSEHAGADLLREHQGCERGGNGPDAADPGPPGGGYEGVVIRPMLPHDRPGPAGCLRLREVFQHLGTKPTGEHCSGMEGCIKEVTEALEKDEEGALKDAGILRASLRVEHY